MKLRHWSVAFLTILALLAGSVVWAQGSTGAIAGKVTDEKGQPLPGATISVKSSYLQGVKGSATDLNGEFTIMYLPPGNDYVITIEAAGYSKVVRSNVTVVLGGTTTLETGLVGGGTEIQVTARPPAVTLKETKVSTNLTQQELETLPISRSYQDTLYLAPTVVSSGSGGNPGVAGSTSSENVWLINGINTTDPVTGTFGTNLNYNFIREMEVNTGGLDAEYGASTGGLFNVLTKSGSNEFHGEVFAYYQNQNFNAKAHSTDMSVAQQNPYHNYDYGFDIGGPIVKDKLWFFVGYNPSLYSTTHQGVSEITNYNPYGGHYGETTSIPYNYNDESRNWFTSAKLTWRVNDKHSLEFAYFGDPSHMWYNEGPFPTIDNNSYMTRRYQGGYNLALTWYAQWNSKVFSEVGVGKTHSILQITPWDEAGYAKPEMVSWDYSPSVSIGGGVGTVLFDNRDTFQVQGKLTWLVPKNEIKMGFAYEDLHWYGFNGYSGGQEQFYQFNFNANNPLSPNPGDYYYWFIYSLQNPNYDEKGRYTALFLQDKWSINDYINLGAGVRWEQSKVMPNNGQELSLDSWSPRISFTWDFMKNGKSKFYANWGQYYERVPIAMATGMDAGHESYTDIFSRFGTRHYAHYVYGAIPTTVLGGAKNQYNEEYLFGASYELSPDLTIDGRAIFRSLGRVLEDVGYIDPNNPSGMSYVIMNPGQQWPSELMNRWAGQVPGYEQFPNPIRNYQGYTISLNKRYSNHWFLNASYTWSQLRGNYEGGSGGYSTAGLNPNVSSAYDIPSSAVINNYYGLLPQDRTHSIKVQGSYKWDCGFTLGSVFQLASGRPMSKVMGWPSSEMGYGTIFVTPRGTAGRMPTTWTLDIHAEYALKIYKSSLSFFADIFNITNNQAQTGYYSTYYQTPDTWTSPLRRDLNWGKTTARQQGRNARLGVRWSF